MVAGFSETDASKISVGQPATVTFNALTGVDLQGKVTQVEINSITVSNVITYNVTVSIVGAPSTLKPGMTANVSITTAEKDNVLELPSSAITATGNTAVVQVLQPNGSTIAKTITIGMRGDTNDEITSGLNAGDRIVVSLGTGSRTGEHGDHTSGSRTGGGFGGLGGAGARGRHGLLRRSDGAPAAAAMGGGARRERGTARAEPAPALHRLSALSPARATSHRGDGRGDRRRGVVKTYALGESRCTPSAACRWPSSGGTSSPSWARPARASRRS